jgi:hypothetical protein
MYAEYNRPCDNDTMNPGKTPGTNPSGVKSPREVPCCVCCGILVGSGNPDEFSGVEYPPNKDPFGEPDTPCCVCCGMVIMTEQDSRTCATECGSCLNCCEIALVIMNGCYECCNCIGQCLACLGECAKALPH